MFILTIVLALLNFPLTWAAIFISDVLFSLSMSSPPYYLTEEERWDLFLSHSIMMSFAQLIIAVLLFFILYKIRAKRKWFVILLSSPLLMLGAFIYAAYQNIMLWPY
ncbi:hypothetical protein PQ478_19410 [Alkalihalophilus pseudofirmus]|uniref:hypothetical protein n=1 Tax=Alkalihalophilus pseudofirmus TaxID=79885 RepID=UPI00259BBC55|nr:hypothetical protein [Alkalihalophilus pseudofirmus]WEG16647.1 hypothetical protein PQ478_19410 [Alkalihalophilus pseudofirmus]